MADGERNGRSGLQVLDAVLLVGAGVIAVVIAFALLHFIAGIIWFFFKAVVVVAVIAGLAFFLIRRRA